MPQFHGPYYQAALCQAWSHNMRKLDRIVRELQAIGLKAAAAMRRP